MDEAGLADVAQGFIGALSGRMDQQSLTPFSTALNNIATATVQRGPLPPLQHVNMQHLQALLPEIADPVIRTAAQSMDWGQVYDGGGIDPVLAEGMFAAQAAGTYGVFAAQHVASGFFLLAPNVFYPLHTHAAGEVYHCLAGEIEISHRLHDAPIKLRANESSETPSGRLHSLRTGDKPVLLAYIWIDDITAPTWWWQQDSEGQWTRMAWRRKPGESWKAENSELVATADYDAAMR